MPELILQPTAVGNDSSYGVVAWANPDGFRVKYFGDATANLNIGEVTQYARGVFDCSSLPAGVTLLEIKVEVQANDRLGNGYPGDASVRIGQAGAPVGDDKARPTQPWAMAQTYRVYGGNADLWNAGLDADTIRASGLEVFFAAKHRADGQPARARGDDMRVTLYYS